MRQQGARRAGSTRGRGRRVARRGGRGGAGAGARGGAHVWAAVWALCVGGRVGEERRGEARSTVLYSGSLTVPRAEAVGTRGRGVPGDGAWHWDVRAPNTASTPPTGSARALSSGASHPGGLVSCAVASCHVQWCVVVWCVVLRSAVVCVVLCRAIMCGGEGGSVLWSHDVRCGLLCCHLVGSGVMCCGLVSFGVVWCGGVSYDRVGCVVG